MPDAAYLRSILEYRDGQVFWKPRDVARFRNERLSKIWNSCWAGKRAGGPMSGGYRMIAVDGVRFLEHRVIHHAFIRPLEHGQEVDHINCDRSDNRIENLRACTHAENSMNQPGRRDGRVPKHVCWSKSEKKYKVRMRVNGTALNLGTYDTLEEASEFAHRYRCELHGDYANHKASRCNR